MSTGANVMIILPVLVIGALVVGGLFYLLLKR